MKSRGEGVKAEQKEFPSDFCGEEEGPAAVSLRLLGYVMPSCIIQKTQFWYLKSYFEIKTICFKKLGFFP